MLCLVLPFLALPAALGFLASFTDYGPTATETRFVGIDNYLSILGDPQFVAAVRNIVPFTIGTVIAEVFLGLGIAYLLRRPFRGRAAVRIALLLPWLVSPVATGVMWHFLLNSTTGLPSFVLGFFGLDWPSPLGSSLLALPTAMLIDVWRKAPLAGFLLLPAVLAIPRERWENARLDGASFFSRLRDIAMPELAPLVLTVALILSGDALGTFDSLLILTGGGPGTATLTPGLYAYQQAFRAGNWPLSATAGWLVGALFLLAGCAYVVAVRVIRRSARSAR